MKYLLTLLSVLSINLSYGANQLEMEPINLNGFYDEEYDFLEKETNEIKHRNKFEKKKTKLVKKRTKMLLEYLPKRAENLKEYKKYQKLDAQASEYLKCLQDAEVISECDELESNISIADNVIGGDGSTVTTSVNFSAELLFKLGKLKDVTLEHFPGFSAIANLTIHFDDQGKSVLVEIKNLATTKNLEAFKTCLNFFLNKYPIYGPANEKVIKKVRF